ncbi:MAG: excinuclease ABC subunit UvrA, partial [bacterium]|nr:excinuclease ABC subunit UvrA [bacterium]
MKSIIIRGAREHNLKNLNLKIPHNKLIVITGVSGSGKSSLAFDTIYAEGQRRYVESLSAYARQFLGQMEKPDIDHIEGLSPAISIEQKSVSKNPRSTVGTITEIFDYLRLLFARIGEQHCYRCGKRITRQSSTEVTKQLMERPEGTKLTILSPLVSGKKGEHHQLIEFAKKEGFVRIRIDGKIQDLSEKISLDKNKKHILEVVVDRLVIKEGIVPRLADSVETAMKLSKGRLIAVCDKEEQIFSSESCCPDCGISYNTLEPRDFSFNSPYGACPSCDGLGSKLELDPDLIVPNKDLSIWQGAIKPIGMPFGRKGQELEALAGHYRFKLSMPFTNLLPEIQRLILYGSEEKLRFDYRGFNSHYSYSAYYEGVIPNLQRRYRQTKSEYIRSEVERYMSNIPCSVCSGKRLKQESLSVLINGSSIADLCNLSVEGCLKFFENLKLTKQAETIASQIIKEIKARLAFLGNVGISYLTLSRTAVTLSGGEGQRIRLATQIGSGLVGVLYVLDEPSIGLHQRDNHKLIDTLKGLQKLGNTVIVVEHDEQMMRSADWVIDLGPGAGKDGGYLVAEGKPADIEKNDASLTGKYLSKALEISLPQKRKSSKGFLRIKGASHNNLKNIDVKIPIGLFTCVTGVSGSGKSSLISETLHPALAGILHYASIKPGHYKAIEGIEYIDKVINITQSPIGRTPRSNPATYTGLFTPIRELFSELPESRVRGYRPGRFSFNIRGGRCEECEGDGEKKIEMFFLP